ncbi:hypothetical protein L249_6036, partial [Ophiocordyceps polyrhachis-furcata BCC 54312]
APGRRAYEGYVTPGRLRPARGRRGGYAVQRLRPYGPYGPYEGRNPAIAAAAAADPEGPFDHRLPRGGEDEGPAPADLAAFFFFFFLPTAGESTANSTLFFFDLCRYGYGYGYGKRPRCYGPSTASSFPLERSFPPDFFGCFFRPYGRPTLAGSKDSPPTLRRHEARRPKTKDTIDWLEKHAFFCRTRPEGLVGSRDAGPATAGPRPPYVTEAERHNNVGGGYAVQRLRPYGPYGPYEGRNGHVTPGRLRPARGRRTSQRLYVTAAERHNNVGGGYAVQRLRPYGPYEGRNV